MTAATEDAIHSLDDRKITITLTPEHAGLIAKMIPVGAGVLSNKALEASLAFLQQVLGDPDPADDEEPWTR